jgi:hypothetical protein
MNDATPLRLQVADQALHIIQTMRQTSYVHADLATDAATTGIYDTDCSGFVSYILGVVAPEHLRMIPRAANKRLLADDYYTFFSGLPNRTADGWRQITAAPEGEPGDLIAWSLPSGSGDTGHVFVVAGQPVPVDGNTTAVMAYDSSDIHHFHDSRDHDSNPPQTGVGIGTFHLTIDSTGIPRAFQFGPGDKVHDDKIAIARVESFES